MHPWRYGAPYSTPEYAIWEEAKNGSVVVYSKRKSCFAGGFFGGFFVLELETGSIHCSNGQLLPRMLVLGYIRWFRRESGTGLSLRVGVVGIEVIDYVLSFFWVGQDILSNLSKFIDFCRLL
jgi:hypothetical protein